ncbi:MAG: hypothetical protein IKF14_18110 [Atopobiaceae bacterium]|nr:hypothetical protein [Atopobiaceae bacterium]MBR3161003.1 hypothetical protein [Atopobiaceae bacterium]
MTATAGTEPSDFTFEEEKEVERDGTYVTETVLRTYGRNLASTPTSTRHFNATWDTGDFDPTNQNHGVDLCQISGDNLDVKAGDQLTVSFLFMPDKVHNGEGGSGVKAFATLYFPMYPWVSYTEDEYVTIDVNETIGEYLPFLTTEMPDPDSSTGFVQGFYVSAVVTAPCDSKYLTLRLGCNDSFSVWCVQVMRGSHQGAGYVPYGYVGIDLPYQNTQLTIPVNIGNSYLEATGDGSAADILSIDMSGNVKQTDVAYGNGYVHDRGSVKSDIGLIANGVTLSSMELQNVRVTSATGAMKSVVDSIKSLAIDVDLLKSN